MLTDTTANNTPAAITDIAPTIPKRPRKKPAPKHDFNDGRGRVFAHRHINGNGWVADTAKVADSVFVGKTAKVYHRAKVSGGIRINNSARVCGAAEIDATGEIKESAFVSGNTKITGQIVIKGFARLYGGKFVGQNQIHGDVRVQNDPTIENCTLQEGCFIAGNAGLTGSTVSGRAMIGEAARIQGSTITGDARVAGDAFVLSSALLYYSFSSRADNEKCLFITDEAKIICVSTLSALLRVGGEGTIVGGTIRFDPRKQNDIPERIECVENLCVVNSDITDVSVFDLFNNANGGRTGMPTPEAIRRAQPVDFNNIVPRRRIMQATT